MFSVQIGSFRGIAVYLAAVVVGLLVALLVRFLIGLLVILLVGLLIALLVRLLVVRTVVVHFGFTPLYDYFATTVLLCQLLRCIMYAQARILRQNLPEYSEPAGA